MFVPQGKKRKSHLSTPGVRKYNNEYYNSMKMRIYLIWCAWFYSREKDKLRVKNGYYVLTCVSVYVLSSVYVSRSLLPDSRGGERIKHQKFSNHFAIKPQ